MGVAEFVLGCRLCTARLAWTRATCQFARWTADIVRERWPQSAERLGSSADGSRCAPEPVRWDVFAGFQTIYREINARRAA